MSGRRVAKRACDGCKIRKIKCTEVAPCEGCIAAEIPCTFVRHPSTRGPRKLKMSTLQEIRQTQQQWEDSGFLAPSTVAPEMINGTNSGVTSAFAPNKIASLVLQLCVYRLRMFSVWPIIKVERLVASLQKRPEPDMEVVCLAYAVAAATMAQITTGSSSQPNGATAEMMEAQCRFTKARLPVAGPPTISTVRIAFFQHIFHENHIPGGMQSILYLREAIAHAHILGLHRESYYKKTPPEEQQIRRRTLWLLFVTERGVSILHKLPVTLRPNITFPSTEDTDEAEVLFAFQKLIHLFWSFDRSGAFELLDRGEPTNSDLSAREPSRREALALLNVELNEEIETDQMNDVQALDITATRQWMRATLWRLSENHNVFSKSSANREKSGLDPIVIAKDFLSAVSKASNTAFEAHGPGLQLKIFEVATSVVDFVILRSRSSDISNRNELDGAREVLIELRRLLSSSKRLDSMLLEKIAVIPQQWALNNISISASDTLSHTVHEDGQNMVMSQPLQGPNHEFGEALNMGASPANDSLHSLVSNLSPVSLHSLEPYQTPPLFHPTNLADTPTFQDQNSGPNPSAQMDLTGHDGQELSRIHQHFDFDPSSFNMGVESFGMRDDDSSTGTDLLPTSNNQPVSFESNIFWNQQLHSSIGPDKSQI